MESLYILIPIAVLLVFLAVSLFIWAVQSEQFDDLERQGMNIILDEEDSSTKTFKENQIQS